MRQPWFSIPALLLAAWSLPLHAEPAPESAICHYAYGGETRSLPAVSGDTPYAVPAIKVGSFFHFRVVAENAERGASGERGESGPGAVKTYVYEDRDSGPVLLHQGLYPWPASEAAGQRYGFTGLHRVYEPLYGSEFAYWCTVRDADKGMK